MGWNEGYTILESTVIGAYDLGKLDKPLLRVLMEPYRNRDIDHGGSRDLRSKDGLSCDEIVVKTLRPNAFANAVKLRREDDYEKYWEAIGDSWYELTRKEFAYW